MDENHFKHVIRSREIQVCLISFRLGLHLNDGIAKLPRK